MGRTRMAVAHTEALPDSPVAARFLTGQEWVIDGAALASYFRMEKVSIINDFAGIGFGLLALEDSDLEAVYGGGKDGPRPQPRAPKAVIGAGTGLGEAYLTHNGSVYDVYPCEGGHTDFAPRNQVEFDIMQHIKKASRSAANKSSSAGS